MAETKSLTLGFLQSAFHNLCYVQPGIVAEKDDLALFITSLLLDRLI